MAQEMILTPLDKAYLPQILTIMRLSYDDHHMESKEVLLVKMDLSRRYGAAAICGDRICGYLLAYPAPPDYVSAIDSPARPKGLCSSLYIHDMAIHPDFRGRRIADRLHDHAMLQAAGILSCSTLVAVNHAAPFWRRLGYQPAEPETEAARQTLASYGEDAVFMRKSLL